MKELYGRALLLVCAFWVEYNTKNELKGIAVKCAVFPPLSE
jgi:hypothetical protein